MDFSKHNTHTTADGCANGWASTRRLIRPFSCPDPCDRVCTLWPATKHRAARQRRTICLTPSVVWCWIPLVPCLIILNFRWIIVKSIVFLLGRCGITRRTADTSGRRMTWSSFILLCRVHPLDNWHADELLRLKWTGRTPVCTTVKSLSKLLYETDSR